MQSISRGVGPDVRVKIKVADGPQVTGISGGSREKWQFQARNDGKDMNQVIDEFLQSGDVKGYDQSEDQTAISAGCGLWDDFEDDVNTADILRRLRANRNNLAAEEAPEGATPKAFLK